MAKQARAVAVTRVPNEVEATPLEKLRSFLDTHGMKGKTGPRAFADFERELHARMMEVERDVIAAEMVKLDIDADAVEIAGKVHRRVLRQSQTFMTSAGEVVVERTLYKDRRDEEGRCVSPMELALGIIGDFWTPRAAQQALWVATQITPKKGAELFERVGNMEPSKRYPFTGSEAAMAPGAPLSVPDKIRRGIGRWIASAAATNARPS